MSFKFGKLILRNFMSIGEIPLEIDLDSCRSTLITGENGAGKTTMIEGLTYILFGKTYRKFVKSDIINEYTNSDCYGGLEFYYGDDKFIVERTISPDSFRLCKWNGSEYVEDEDIVAGKKNQQSKFEVRFGLEYNIYKRLIVLGTSGYEEFLKLSTPDRRKFLESVFGFDIILLMDSENKGIIKNQNLKLDQIDAKIIGLENQKEQSKESQERLKQIIENTKKNLKEYNKELEEKEEELIELKNVYEISYNELSETSAVEEPELEARMVLPLEFRNKRDEIISKVEDGISSQVLGVDECSMTLRTIEKNINTLRGDINLIERDKGVLSTVLDRYDKGGECPSCLQHLSNDNDNVKIIYNTMAEKDEEIKVIEKDIEKLNVEKLENNKLIEEANLKKKELEDYKEKVLKQIKKQEDKLIEKNKEIDERNRTLELNYQKELYEYKTIEDKVKRNKNSLDKCEKELENINLRIRNTKKEILEIETSHIGDENEILDNVQETIDNLNIEKEEILVDIMHRNVISDLLKDDGIRGDMISRYIPLLNKTIQKYLDILGADYLFMVDVNFNEIIQSRSGKKRKYESFSSGEKARIDIAIMFSWREVVETITGQKITTLFLDEVFDSSTDISGVENIKKVMDTLEDVNIFTISHRDHDVNDFDSIVRVNKVGRFSSYERDYN